MADRTLIEWTDATWNPIVGCSVVSAGCINCYAMRLAGTRLRNHPSRAGLTRPSKAGPVWTGEVRLNERALLQPARWRKPRRIFVCAHGDLFHEQVPDQWIDDVWGVMFRESRHRFQVLTKRSDRSRRWTLNAVCPQHIWCGVSVEDKMRADRIVDLVGSDALTKFLSCEPLLGPLDLEWCLPMLNWVIVGGESGPNARSMNPDWARSIRDQCAKARVPFFMKQMSRRAPIPADLMVREFPNV